MRPARRLVAGLAPLVAAALLLPACSGDGDTADGALATERQRRASGIELAPDERFLWGNLVVHATGDETVELMSVELLGASDGLRLRRSLVADGRRPQTRLLVFGERAFERLPNREAWRRSLHPLPGYQVEPVDGPWAPGSEGFETRDGLLRDTEIVLEFEPLGRGSFQVRDGVRVRYRVGDAEAPLDLPNQLSVCAPAPCRVTRPKP